jgi:hypothetical protein
MKKQMLCFICLCIPLFCTAQVYRLYRQYEYDDAGNRIVRKVVTLKPQDLMPPAPQDSILVTHDYRDSRDQELQTSHLTPHTADFTPPTSNFYVEKIAQTEIKIYPNPTAEKITLEIAGWEALQTGIFKLYTMTGQLLQERVVYSMSTEVSLAGLSKGTYILKVQINDKIEDWKIIKQ